MFVLNEDTIKLLKKADAAVSVIKEIINDILDNNVGLYAACKKHGMHPQTFYRKLGYLTNESDIQENKKIKRNMNKAYPVNLYKDIFDTARLGKTSIPDDYQKRLRVVKKELTPEELEVFKCFYEKDMSFREIGCELDMSHEKARYIKIRILKKMTRPHNIEILTKTEEPKEKKY